MKLSGVSVQAVQTLFTVGGVSRYIMAQVEALPGCFGTCPHLKRVQGSCDHDLRPLIVSYLREHPDASCPVYEEFRAQEMRDLADRLEQH